MNKEQKNKKLIAIIILVILVIAIIAIYCIIKTNLTKNDKSSSIKESQEGSLIDLSKTENVKRIEKRKNIWGNENKRYTTKN